MEVTLAAGILTVVSHSLNILKSVGGTYSRWQEAPFHFKNLLNEFNSVTKTLIALERIIAAREEEELPNGWTVSLMEIREVMDEISRDVENLEERLRRAVGRTRDDGALGPGNRFKLLWSDAQIEQYTTFYRARKEYLNPHINTLSLETTLLIRSDIQRFCDTLEFRHTSNALPEYTPPTTDWATSTLASLSQLQIQDPPKIPTLPKHPNPSINALHMFPLGQKSDRPTYLTPSVAEDAGIKSNRTSWASYMSVESDYKDFAFDSLLKTSSAYMRVDMLGLNGPRRKEKGKGKEGFGSIGRVLEGVEEERERDVGMSRENWDDLVELQEKRSEETNPFWRHLRTDALSEEREQEVARAQSELRDGMSGGDPILHLDPRGETMHGPVPTLSKPIDSRILDIFAPWENAWDPQNPDDIAGQMSATGGPLQVPELPPKEPLEFPADRANNTPESQPAECTDPSCVACLRLDESPESPDRILDISANQPDVKPKKSRRPRNKKSIKPTLAAIPEVQSQAASNDGSMDGSPSISRSRPPSAQEAASGERLDGRFKDPIQLEPDQEEGCTEPNCELCLQAQAPEYNPGAEEFLGGYETNGGALEGEPQGEPECECTDVNCEVCVRSAGGREGDAADYTIDEGQYDDGYEEQEAPEGECTDVNCTVCTRPPGTNPNQFPAESTGDGNATGYNNDEDNYEDGTEDEEQCEDGYEEEYEDGCEDQGEPEGECTVANCIACTPIDPHIPPPFDVGENKRWAENFKVPGARGSYPSDSGARVEEFDDLGEAECAGEDCKVCLRSRPEPSAEEDYRNDPDESTLKSKLSRKSSYTSNRSRSNAPRRDSRARVDDYDNPSDTEYDMEYADDIQERSSKNRYITYPEDSESPSKTKSSRSRKSSSYTPRRSKADNRRRDSHASESRRRVENYDDASDTEYEDDRYSNESTSRPPSSRKSSYYTSRRSRNRSPGRDSYGSDSRTRVEYIDDPSDTEYADESCECCPCNRPEPSPKTRYITYPDNRSSRSSSRNSYTTSTSKRRSISSTSSRPPKPKSKPPQYLLAPPPSQILNRYTPRSNRFDLAVSNSSRSSSSIKFSMNSGNTTLSIRSGGDMSFSAGAVLVGNGKRDWVEGFACVSVGSGRRSGGRSRRMDMSNF